MIWILGFFFISGFCSLLYEVIWMRLAMADFGVTTALTSIVISMFMAGLGAGSWGSGVLIKKSGYRFGFPALRLYAVLELLIGVSSLVVPLELSAGRSLLSGLDISSSSLYYVVSGLWIAITLIPWCACMGATIPVVMLAIKNDFNGEASRAFSFLYLANVLGAVIGALAPLVLIELYGFHGTLRIGAVFNVLLAVSAFALSATMSPQRTPAVKTAPVPSFNGNRGFLVLLFGTGFTSMGIEVVWIRQYTPFLGTLVYAFAAILAVYLISTFIGSQIYRLWSVREREHSSLLWSLFGFTAILAAVATNPDLHLDPTPYFFGITEYLPRLAIGIAPFSAVAGFATPLLVDRWSGGDPDRAGRAYAANVLGCIFGPLVAGFIMLPLMNERVASLVFALPWLVGGAVAASSSVRVPRMSSMRRAAPYAIGLAAIALLVTSKGFEEQFPKRAVMRDNTATVVAVGEGFSRRLIVNGVGMTWLSPDTKTMAHLPLASLDHKPGSALTICFGMGTTFRSLLSWNIQTTVVELVPSVPKLFWYFHEDANQVLSNPLGHVVIDDGRRFLERTSDKYDVITIDPPPPVEAAASSLLYSREFYAAAKKHLRPGGILQQWLTHSDPVERAAITRAVTESFPYVRMFRSVTRGERVHYLASDHPIAKLTPEELVQRMPPAAIKDLIELGPEKTPQAQLARVVDHELSAQDLVAGTPNNLVLVDDRPANEYFFVRERIQKNRNYSASAKLDASPER